MKKNRVAVIGAGPMGLGVAYELAQNGLQPVLFESDDRVGGMTATFDFSGERLERYYHFHCTSDSAFFTLLNELGLSDKMHWAKTRMGYWFQNRVQPWGSPVALLKFKGIGWIAKFRYGLHAFYCTRRNDWLGLDKVEATSWIRQWVGAQAYEVLWKRLFDYKFYNYAKDLSGAWIWSRIRRIGRSRYNIFQEKLGYLEGGSTTFLQAMIDDILSKSGELRLNSPVEKVVLQNGRVKGLEVDGQLEPFDSIISTIPLPLVPDIIPDLPPEIITQYRALRNVAVVCVIVSLSKSVTGNFWLNTNDPEMDIPGIVEYTNLRPMGPHVVYVPYYMPEEHPKYQEPDAAFDLKVRKCLKTINPDLAESDFLDVHVSRYQYAQPVCGPGFLKTLPSPDLPVDGLWVADTSHYYPEDRGISESLQFGRALAQEAMA